MKSTIKKTNGGPPEQAPWRLLVIAGLTPQVVTEALYVLAIAERQPVGELKIFTTPEGKKAVENVLLLEAGNPLDKLCRAYGLNRSRIQFGDDDVISVWESGPLAEEDLQLAAADRMMKHLTRWTADDQPPLAVCVAGGRKNMGVLFVQVFSLLARPLDRLFHLVVSPEFENLPGFFFPPPQPATVESYSKGCGVAFLNSAEARITAVEIPIIRLRSLTDEATRQGLLGFSPSRERVQSTVETTDTKLYIDPARLEIRYRGMTIQLPPREFALYHFFCRIRKEGWEPYCRAGIPTDKVDDPQLVEWLEQSYRLVKPARRFEELSWIPRTKAGELDFTEFKEKVGHGVSKIKRRLGESHPARIVSRKLRTATYYTLDLDAADIVFSTET